MISKSSGNRIWGIYDFIGSLDKAYVEIFDLFRSGIDILGIRILIVFLGSVQRKMQMYDATQTSVTFDAHGKMKKLTCSRISQYVAAV